jgi:hypothetical protein
MGRTVSSCEDADRRAAPRWSLSELPWPIACRIMPGQDVVIVDISTAGMLVESPAPLFPGRNVKLHLARSSQSLSVQGTVVRGYLAALDSIRGPTFRAAIAFEQPFEPLRDLLRSALH